MHFFPENLLFVSEDSHLTNPLALDVAEDSHQNPENRDVFSAKLYLENRVFVVEEDSDQANHVSGVFSAKWHLENRVVGHEADLKILRCFSHLCKSWLRILKAKEISISA